MLQLNIFRPTFYICASYKKIYIKMRSIYCKEIKLIFFLNLLSTVSFVI